MSETIKKTGYIVYNGFWNDEPPDSVRRLVSSARKTNMGLVPVANNNTAVIISSDGVRIMFDNHEVLSENFVIFFDKDIRLCEALEAKNIKVFNNSKAILLCDDKSATHLQLAKHKIPMPKTIFAPLTYRKMEHAKWQEFYSIVTEHLSFPIVIKECYGSLGGQVYLASNGEEFFAKIDDIQPRPFLCQQFISSTAGSDIRIYVVGGKVVAAIKRISTNGDFRANVGSGGKGESYCPSEVQIKLALNCTKILGLDFAGIDILIDDKGDSLVCEVNSNAQMKEISTITGVCVSDEIMKHILKVLQAL